MRTSTPKDMMTTSKSSTRHPEDKHQAQEGERIVPLRLQKFLARAGVASRRGSEDLMTAGRVTVNGVVVTELGSKVDPRVDVVCVDGREVRPEEGHTYLMLNKPGGYVTTMDDPQGRPCVAQLIPTDEHPGLYPVGRLDRDTTGLLLFMTDGELGAALLHPSHHVRKRYEAEVDGRVFDVELDPLRAGITLDDGPCKPAEVEVLEEGPTSKVACTISEGRKHQVKRMFAAIDHEVLRLHRSGFGPLTLDGLPLGKWRLLTYDEVSALKAEAYD